jgi:hypothetical protein
MITSSRILLVILLVVSGLLKALADEPTWVTAKQLLRTPQEFDQKQVCALGYFDGSSLFANYCAAKQKRASITIDPTTFLNPEMLGNAPAPLPGITAACDLKTRYVRIIGTFQYRGGRSNGSSTCEITHIVYFRATRKSPDTKVRPCGMYPGKSSCPPRCSTKIEQTR